MNLISSEKKDNNEVELTIEVTPEEIEAEMQKAYLKNKNRISVPGFRKGKAPRGIIERMYGIEMFLSDALDNILPGVLRYVMYETEHDIVGYPKVTDVDMKDENTRAEFKLIAAIRPEVKIGKYKGISAPKPTVEIPDSEINSEIAAMRERNARIEKVDRPAENGDIAVIDFEGFVNDVAFEGGKGENYELTLGSGQFIPGFEEKVEGMAVGEERDIDLVFPLEYKKDLAGKAVVFKVKLNEVKEKILPDLDDEFAMDVSEFDTLDEYKADIRERILKTRQQDVDDTFENILMEKVIDTLEADVPEAMIEEQFENSMNKLNRQVSAYGMDPAQYMQMMGVTPDEFKERMRGNSEKQVKISLALEKISELEGIAVSDSEIDEEYEEASKRYNMEVDKLKESVTRADIVRDLKLQRAAKIVVDNAVIEEEDSEKPKTKKPPAKKSTAKKTAVKKTEPEKKDNEEE